MTTTLTRPAVRLAGAAGLTAVFLLGTAGVADASCAPPPATSAFAFTGTVLTTSDSDRVAQVRTDTGAEVTVLGTPNPGTSGVTSVDRTFIAGARYEFHPLNEASPYRDNLCTATRQLATTAEPTPTPTAAPTPTPTPTATPTATAAAKAQPTAAPAVAELPRTGSPGWLPVTGLLMLPVGAALTYRFRSVRPATRSGLP